MEKEDQSTSLEQFDENLNEHVLDIGDLVRETEEFLPEVNGLSLKDLLKTFPKEFVKYKHKSDDLKPFVDEATSKVNKYVLERNMLFYKKKNKNGTERKLIVPKKFREQLKFFLSCRWSGTFRCRKN